LPSSRSVTVGTPATAFANTSSATATGCHPSLVTPVAADFAYQTTDPTTNAVTGSPNTPVDIPAQSSQSFVFAITPSAAVAPSRSPWASSATTAPPPPSFGASIPSTSSAEAGPVPDIIALVALPPEREGFVDVQGPSGTDKFGVASVNVGSASPLS